MYVPLRYGGGLCSGGVRSRVAGEGVCADTRCVNLEGVGQAWIKARARGTPSGEYRQ